MTIKRVVAWAVLAGLLAFLAVAPAPGPVNAQIFAGNSGVYTATE